MTLKRLLVIVKNMIADIISVSRIFFSLLLLIFSPSSYLFMSLYLLCGITDVLDGFAARKLHTESEKGARLDSAADLVFTIIYAVRILPTITIPLWIWIWTAVIAAVKITGIIIASKKEHKLCIRHSFANKLTGLLIFLLPLSVYIANAKYGAIIVCMAASFSTIEEIIKLMHI